MSTVRCRSRNDRRRAHAAAERSLLKDEFDLIIALDEVGRRALAGPVVGAAVMDAAGSRRRVPAGLRDRNSSLERRRADMAAHAAGWVQASAVGWATAAEIDDVGIITALGRAASRAVDAVMGERWMPRALWSSSTATMTTSRSSIAAD